MEQPFYVGQKIVRIVTSEYGKEGDVHTCLGLLPCKCGFWNVDIGGRCPFNLYITVCPICEGEQLVTNGIMWYDGRSFAPIQPAYADITAELAKDAVPETSDVVKVKEAVN